MKKLVTTLAILVAGTTFAQDNRFDKLFKETDEEFKKQVLIPNYVEYEKEITLPRTISWEKVERLRNLRNNNTDVFILNNFRNRSPNIEVYIELPNPNVNNNLPHYINQMMFKPPQVHYVEIK